MVNPKPWVKTVNLGDFGARFILTPLTRGLGTTLGNSLRRVLLSSLFGAAPIAIQIEGVDHEFTTIPNIVEDVVDIIFNIKGIVFNYSGTDTKVVILKYSGKGEVTAADIKLDSDISIVNPTHHIAEATGNVKLDMKIFIENGVGYVAAESNQRPDQDIHTIAIDSSFSPVTRVNHEVENIRVGKDLDHDQLTIDVWTNGSVKPEEAIQKAADILIEKIGLFKHLNEKPDDDRVKESSKAVSEALQSGPQITIDDLELSARSSNCLKRAGIDDVASLLTKSVEDLIAIKNFGAKSAEEIDTKLRQYGLSLRQVESVA